MPQCWRNGHGRLEMAPRHDRTRNPSSRADLFVPRDSGSTDAAPLWPDVGRGAGTRQNLGGNPLDLAAEELHCSLIQLRTQLVALRRARNIADRNLESTHNGLHADRRLGGKATQFLEISRVPPLPLRHLRALSTRFSPL